jgi:tetrapyrrole methylase family protein/MazG family protein
LAKLIIVGLGPGDPDVLTKAALKTLEAAHTVYLRTAKHPTVPFLPKHLTLEAFDAIYDRSENFAEVYATITAQLLELAASSLETPVIYAVPGHPLVGESSVLRLLSAAKAQNIEADVVAGLSFIEPVCTALELDPLQEGLTILDATELAIRAEIELPREKGFGLPVLKPLLISQIYNSRLASSVKLALMENYPDEHPVVLLRGAGLVGADFIKLEVPLYELDRHPEVTDHLTCAYLPPLPILQALGTFENVQYVIARLRAPEGCPWDRKQTHDSLKRYLIEETYEVVHALDEDPDKLAEELGDLLLQVLLHAQIAAEDKEFTIADVMTELGNKMIRRHPHVFGEAKVEGAEEVVRNWEQLKKAERATKGEEVKSVLAGVPRDMPALLQAQNLQRRAADLGFEWHNYEQVLDKLVEEVGELRQTENEEERLEEMGDILMMLANTARWMKLDAEEALRLANNKFRRRFEQWEEIVCERNLDARQMTSPEIEALWQEARQRAGH